MKKKNRWSKTNHLCSRRSSDFVSCFFRAPALLFFLSLCAASISCTPKNIDPTDPDAVAGTVVPGAAVPSVVTTANGVSVASVSTTTATGTYPAGTVVDVAVGFSGAVTVVGIPAITLNTTPPRTADYVSGSGSSTLLFNYTVQAGDSGTPLDYASVLALSAGTSIQDSSGVDANLTLPATGSSSFFAATVAVDATPAPTVASVTTTTNAGTYKTGDAVNVTVNFSKAVLVASGTPQITLATNPNRTVNYTSGSGSTALVFTYTVVGGDTVAQLDYLSTSALALGGATIKDAVGNDATLTLPSTASSGLYTKNIAIDGVAPTVASVTTTTNTGTHKIGDQINVTVNFTKAVTVASGPPQITLATSPNHAVNYASGSGSTALVFTYTVQAGDTAAQLDYLSTSALALNGATIKDTAGNNATLALPATTSSGLYTKNIVIDGVAPTVVSVTTSSSGSHKAGDAVNVTVNFSKIVNVTGTPQITLATAPNETVDYVSGSGSTALVFTYTVQPGDAATDLDYLNTSALDLNSGAVQDSALNDAVLTLPPTTTSALYVANIKIDTTAPLVTSVTTTTPTGIVRTGASVNVTVNFSKIVNVTGTPQITLATTPHESINYVSGSGSTALVFTYTVQTGDAAAQLDYLSTSALALSGGVTIQDAALNDAALTLPATGSSALFTKNIAINMQGPYQPFSYAIGDNQPDPWLTSVQLSPDGTFIVAAGELTDDQDNSYWFVQRYSGAGFATVDTLETDYAVAGSNGSEANSVAISSDGLSIVAGGWVNDAGGQKWLLKRYSGAGFATVDTLESGFVIAGGTNAQLDSVAISSDGLSIVAGGSVNDANNVQEWVLKRYSGAGFATVDTLESSFAITGGTSAQLSSVAISSDGLSIVAGGVAFDADGQKWVLKRYSGAGFATVDTLESSFAVTGGTQAFLRSVAISSDGLSIVAGGFAFDADGQKWVLKRYSGAGFATVDTLESSFAITGGISAQLSSVAISSDGLSIVAGGMAQVADTDRWVVKRYTGAGYATVSTTESSLLANQLAGSVMSLVNSLSLATDGSWYVAGGFASSLDDEFWFLKTQQIASTYVDDPASPTITSVTTDTNTGVYGVGTVINTTVHFSSAVTVAGGTPTLALDTVPVQSASYTLGSGSSSLVFTYTVQAGDRSSRLDYLYKAALRLNGATIRDGAAHNAVVSLPDTGTSALYTKNIQIDATTPTVSYLSTTTAPGAYAAANVINVTVHFSEAVTVTGTPQITLGTSPSQTADYASGSGTTGLVFNYTVQAGDYSPHLDYVSTSALLLTAGATIKSATATDANLTLPGVGTTSLYAANIRIGSPTAPTGLVLKTPNHSPSTNATPTITISGVTSGGTANLYQDDSSCGAGNLVSLSSVSGPTVDITPNIFDQIQHTFYATATDPAGAQSACSSANVVYQYLPNIVLVSSTDGTAANEDNSGTTTITAFTPDGRYVLFDSNATNFVANTSGKQSYVKDLQTGAITLVSSTDGTAAGEDLSGTSYSRAITPDGRYIAFISSSTTFVSGASGGQVYMKDLQGGAIRLVSSTDGSAGNRGNSDSRAYSITADGRYVAFGSVSSNLVTGAQGAQVYVKDLQGGAITLESSTDGTFANEDNSNQSVNASMTPDGRYILFMSYSSNFVAGATGGQVYLKDRLGGSIRLVSSTDGTGANVSNKISTPSAITPDGRYVVFSSEGTNLFPSASGIQAYLKDMQTGSIRLASSTDGTVTNEANNDSGPTAITPDGRYVGLYSRSTNLVSGTSGLQDAILRDLQSGEIGLVNSLDGTAATESNYGIQEGPFVNFNSNYGLFSGTFNNLVAGASGNQAYIKFTNLGPTVLVTYPAENTYIAAADAGAVTFSGFCSEEGRNVTIHAGSVTATPTCAHGIWSAVLDVSGVAHGTLTVTADQTNASGVSATQASRIFRLVAPLLASASVTNTEVSDTVATRTYNLSFSGEVGTYTKYCILENDTTVADCTTKSAWVTGTLPSSYTVSNTDGAKVLTVWLQNGSGDISAPVSTGSVILDTTPPSAPTTLTLTTPATSPSATNGTPVITVGGVTSGDTVGLYLDSACSVALFRGSAVAADVTVAVTTTPLSPYHVLTLYANATDPVGNQSACSTASVNYRYTPSIALVSSTDGTAANEGLGGASSASAITPDGRYVVITSIATNLVTGASGSQIYLNDLATGSITLVSSTDGTVANEDLPGSSFAVSITADGRYVLFASSSSNLVPGAMNSQIYLKDVQGGVVTLVSSTDGTAANEDTSGTSNAIAITPDGRYVLFYSDTTNLVPGAAGTQAYVKDLKSGALSLVSSLDGTPATEGNNYSYPWAISPDGRYVVFASYASNLVPGVSGGSQAYMKDLLTGALTLVSSVNGVAANDTSQPTAITPDGRYVAFISMATNLVNGAVGNYEAYLKDLQSGSVALVSSTDGTGANEAEGSSTPTAIIPDGRYVLFESNATNLVVGAIRNQVYLKDLQSNDVTLVTAIDGTVANSESISDGWSDGRTKITPDANYVVFHSSATNLVTGTTGQQQQAYVKFFNRAPSVSVTYPVANSSLNPGAAVVSGNCSEEGQNVVINVATVTDTQVCTYGMWSSTLDLTSVTHGAITVTADHSTAAQASRSFVLGIPLLASVSVSNTHSPGEINTTTFDLTFVGESGAYAQYCILENDTSAGANCAGNWQPGPLPAYYTVADLDGARVLTVWLKNGSGDISSPVSTGSVTLDRVAPSAPTGLTLKTPASSPSVDNATPVIIVAGVTSGDSIGLYLDSACSVALLRGSHVASGASVNVTASPLPPYHGLTLYAAATDPAGNQSACSQAKVDYQYNPIFALVSSTDGTAAGEDNQGGAIPITITPDGRYVLLVSSATNLVPGTSGTQVYVKDLVTGAITLVSSTNGTGVNRDNTGTSSPGGISPDGRYVVFYSAATNFVSGTSGIQAYLKDLQSGDITLVSSTDGTAAHRGDSDSYPYGVTPDGRYVVFESLASNLLAVGSGDQTYVKDLSSGGITLVSQGSGTAGDGYSAPAAITPDGRYVFFQSSSTNLVSGKAAGTQAYLRDMQTRAITLVSSTDGTVANEDGSGSSNPYAITPDGRYALFSSTATNFVSGTSGYQVYLKDLQSGGITLVSSTDGSAANEDDSGTSWPNAITPDGRYVSFTSSATVLVAGSLRAQQPYLNDLQGGTIQLVDSPDGSSTGVGNSGGWSTGGMTPDAKYVLFVSESTNLVSNTKGPQAFIKYIAQGPTVSVTYPAENSYIAATDAGAVKFSGFCSEEGQAVVINAGGVSDTKTCTYGMWSTTLDISGVTHGPLTVTADHSSAGGVAAPQAKRSFGLGIPVLLSVAVTNTSGPGAIDTATFDLSYSAEFGANEKYCILENGADITKCTWVKGSLPASYVVTSGGGPVVLTIWLQNASGDISAPVSTPAVLLTVATASIRLVSSTDGTAANEGDDLSNPIAITPDGHYALFNSPATNLVSGATGPQVYVKNLANGAITLVSSTDGTAKNEGDGFSNAAAITPDGRYVVFDSNATNFVSGVTGGQVFMKDLVSGVIRLASSTDGTAEHESAGSNPIAITPDGRYVLFVSYNASMLVSGSSGAQVFLKDFTSAAITLVSSTDGTAVTESDSAAIPKAITPDGRYVLFYSDATNLVSGATGPQAYLKDLTTGQIQLVSSTDGSSANEGRTPQGIAVNIGRTITPDGRYVLFDSSAINFVSGASGVQAYLKDLQTSAITLVSSADGTALAEGDGATTSHALTPDGRYVLFDSVATNLVSGATGSQAYLKDLTTGQIQLVSSTDGLAANEATAPGVKGNAAAASLTPDARAVMFRSKATNFVSGASGDQAYIKSYDRGPVVMLTYPVDHSYILASNGGALHVSGYCSEEGQDVSIHAGGVVDHQTCTYGMWSSTLDISGEPHGAIRITADHSSSKSVSAPQASRDFTFGVPVLGAVAVSNTTGTSLMNTTTFDLTFTGELGAYAKYCVLENNTDVSICTWMDGPFPGTYVVTGTEIPKVLTVWLKDSTGAISTPVSTPSVTLDTTPPSAPTTLTLFTPASSPSATIGSPGIRVGGLTAGDTLALYLDSGCTLALQVGSRISDGPTSLIAASPLPPYSVLSLYAAAIDPAGNHSPCSAASVSYQYMPPIALVSSTDGTGAQKDNNTANPTTITPDGKFVLFGSAGTNLVPGTTGSQVYLKNLHTGAVTLVSTTDGTVAHRGNSGSTPAGMTPDGRYVVFSSDSTNFVLGTSGSQVYMKDLSSSGVTLVSSLDGTALTYGDGQSIASAITPDGRYVLFSSQATNLVSGASGYQAYLKDLTSGSVTLVSSTDGTSANQSDGTVWSTAISADAATVLFSSNASNLVPGVSGPQSYVKNLSTGVLQLVSSVDGTAATQSNAGYQAASALTPDGRYVLFGSDATNLMNGAVGFQSYLKDLDTGAIQLVSSVDGTTASTDPHDWSSPTAITPDGRYVLFDYSSSIGHLLLAGVTGPQTYIKDLASGAILLVSTTDGTPGGIGDGTSLPSALTSDARLLLMQSTSTNFVPSATGAQAYVKYISRGPSVSITYPAANSSINPPATGAVTVSGYCSEEGVLVNVTAGAPSTHAYDVNAPQTCTYGMWSTVMNLSGVPHGPAAIVASSGASPQITRLFNIGMPTLDAVHVTNTSSTGIIGTRTFALGYSGESGAYTKYCILEGDTDVNHCTWMDGPLPSTYVVTAGIGAKVLRFWLKNATGDISQSVSALPVNLEAAVAITDDFTMGTPNGVTFGTLSDGSSQGLKLADAGGCDGSTTNCSALDLNWTPQYSHLVSYLRFESAPGTIANGDTVTATVGDDATAFAGTVLSYTSAGKIGAGIYFGSSHLEIPSSAATNLTGHFTLSGWTKLNSVGESNLIEKYDSPGLNGYALRVNSGVVTALSRNSSSIATVFGATTLSAGVWYHLAAVYNGSTLRVYVNGVLDGAVNTSINATVGSGTLKIGGLGDTGGSIYNGILDEIAIWDTDLSAADLGLIYSRQSAPYSGSFLSRIMDALTSVTWNSFSWNTTLPFFKELPDYANGAVQNEVSAKYSSLVGSTGTPGDNDLMSGIVGLWHLDEFGGTVAHDTSGAGRDGAVHGAVGVGVAGKLGKAMSFGNSASQYISATDAGLPSGNDNRTIAFWAYPKLTNQQYYVVFSYGDWATNNMLDVGIQADNDSWFVSNYGGRVYGATPVANTWQHVACTYDGTTWRIYINGTLGGSGSMTTATTLPGTMWIGRTPSNELPSSFAGSIDEVAIWSRALGATEVQQLYQRGASRIKYQVRACTDGACASGSPAWQGPDGTPYTYFSELDNRSVQSVSPGGTVNAVPPVLTLQSYFNAPARHRYFQYRTTFESDASSTRLMPELQSVTATGLP